MTGNGSHNLPPASGSVVRIFLGSMVVGIMMEQSLLGVICFQAIAYFRHHASSDGAFYRAIVTRLVISTIFLGILDFTMLYRNLVSNYDDSEKFDLEDWIAWTEPSLTAWIAFVSHIFYIFRCWAITRSLAVCVFLGVVAFSALTSGITFTILCFLGGRLSNLSGAVSTSISWLLLTVICDLSIAIVLVLYLWRKERVLCSSNAVISRLQLTSIETGLLTAVCALLNLILFLSIPDKGYDMLIHYSISHLYTISVLYTLLAREGLRSILHGGFGTLVSGFQSSFLAAGALPTASPENRLDGEVYRRRNQTSIFLQKNDYISWECVNA